MNRSTCFTLFASITLGVAGLAHGQATDMKGMDMKAMPMGKAPTTATYAATGVVTSVDAAKGMVTLAHEPILGLNWPAMTMGFKVQDKRLLGKAKPGAKVKFTLVQVGTNYEIISIQ